MQKELSLKLFRHTLTRISGGNIASIKKLNSPILDEYLKNIPKYQQRLERLKIKISEQIYPLVPSKNKVTRNKLIQIRRDVYNMRPFHPNDFTMLRLSTSLKKSLNNYISMLQTINEQKHSLRLIAPGEMKAIQDNFLELTQSSIFQKGLILSSSSLLKSLFRFHDHYPMVDKRDRKTQRSLLKYLTRMHTKTSPFSTFTHLALSTTNNTGSSHTKIPCSVIRLNNKLYKYLRQLLFSNPTIYSCFLIRVNPTLKRKGDCFEVFTNSDNLESFQRIKTNPALLYLYTLMQNNPEITLGSFISLALQNPKLQTSEDELGSYMYRLIKFGLFEFNFPVSGTDPNWDTKLIEILSTFESKNPFIHEIIQTLQLLRGKTSEYADASVLNRQAILQDAFNHYRDLCYKLYLDAKLPKDEQVTFFISQKNDNRMKKKSRKKENGAFIHNFQTAFTFKAQQIFYEDSTIPFVETIPRKDLKKNISNFNTLLLTIPVFILRNEQYRMAHFFKQKYGLKSEIDLMNFYETYYREVKKPQSKDKRLKKSFNKRVKSIQIEESLQKNWLKSFVKFIRPEISSYPDEVALSESLIDTVNKSLKQTYPSTKYHTMGAFIQFYRDEKKQLCGVINAHFPGYGKMVSRFLHLFDDKVTKDIRHWNEQIFQNKCLVENTDASFFNANLHPPLMPKEVWVPNGQNIQHISNQIPLTDLSLKYGQQSKEIHLFRKSTQEQVYIFDLGFQGLNGRSELFKFLNNFSPDSVPHYYPILRKINLLYSRKPHNHSHNNMIIKPRITYGRQIVLQRKSWIILKKFLPFEVTKEKFPDNLLALNNWRRKFNIPQCVFCYKYRQNHATKISIKLRKKLKRSDYKPQFIDFQSPLLVGLFLQIMNTTPHQIELVEMLPHSSESIRDNSRIIEHVIQWSH